MIQLTRLPAPPILEDRAAQWTVSFVARRAASPGLRPDTRQYAHPEILDALEATSSRKCFYCERKLGTDERTVDHHTEVHEDPALAFAWSNLYLACNTCQRKLTRIPNADTVDPCAEDPAAHLEFHEEVVIGRTPRGRKTIQKYKLDAEAQELRRLKALKPLLRLIPRPGEAPRPDLAAVLWQFAATEQPYSAMFRCVLEQARVPRG